jgi:hypothetical protein
MAKHSHSQHRHQNHSRNNKTVRLTKPNEEDEKSAHEREADRLLDRQIGECANTGKEAHAEKKNWG